MTTNNRGINPARHVPVLTGDGRLEEDVAKSRISDAVVLLANEFDEESSVLSAVISRDDERDCTMFEDGRVTVLDAVLDDALVRFRRSLGLVLVAETSHRSAALEIGHVRIEYLQACWDEPEFLVFLGFF
jgi:hypothetical protein